MSDIKYGVLDIKYWTLDIKFWILNIGYWIFPSSWELTQGKAAVPKVLEPPGIYSLDLSPPWTHCKDGREDLPRKHPSQNTWENLGEPAIPCPPTCLPDGRSQICLRRFPGPSKPEGILQELDLLAEVHLQDGDGLGHARRQEPEGVVGFPDESLPDADLVRGVHPDIVHLPRLETVQELGIAIPDLQA